MPIMDEAEHQSDLAFLRRCAAVYEAMVERVLALEARGDDEKTLKWLSFAAILGWAAHPGRFADGRLEAVALRAGERLRADSGNPTRKEDGRRHVLHVATLVYETGGHTRLIENWIRNDDESLHSLALLDQPEPSIRAELADRIAASGGEVIVVPAGWPLLDKARRLRQLAQSGYDLVVLHHHPNDVVPLVALATPDCPPVAAMNHADHIFWLGTSVADAVINFREYGALLSLQRRGARHSLLLPMPLDLASQALGRAEARAKLGITDTEVMLLSIGSSYKYTPTRKYNFFRTLHRILDENPAARLYVIGIDEQAFRSYGVPRHERFELLGLISDPSAYEAAADLYLESFPYGSYTALIETTARGTCPVLMYAPTSHTDISGDIPLKGLVAGAADEADYVARVAALIGDPARRTELGEAVARNVVAIHGSAAARTYLQQIYEWASATRHRPAPVPARQSAESEDDLSLARSTRPRIKTAILVLLPIYARTGLTIGDLLRLLVISLRTGDTRLTPSFAKSWAGALWRKAFRS